MNLTLTIVHIQQRKRINYITPAMTPITVLTLIPLKQEVICFSEERN